MTAADREGRSLLRRWEQGAVSLPIPGAPRLRGWTARRDHHRYLVTLDPLHPGRGYGCSYQDARQTSPRTRYLLPPEGDQFPDLASAQAACEADLHRLLGRLQ